MTGSSSAEAGAASELPSFPNPFFLMTFAGHDYTSLSTGFLMRTLLEKQLDTFTHTIRQKPQWWQQVHSDEIVQKWGKEAAQAGVADDVFAFGIQQLKHFSGQCTADGVRPSPVSLVYESETPLEGGLHDKILVALKPLVEVPEDQKDWCPGSANQVLELVDPCLFPLVQGLSRSITLPRYQSGHPEVQHSQLSDWKACMGAGATIQEDDHALTVTGEDEPVFISERFQWLPSDVAVDSGGRVQFLSYINNMHPEWHSQLYTCTAALLERSIPLFERVLAAAASDKNPVIWPPEDNGLSDVDTDELDADEDTVKEKYFNAPKIPEEFVPQPAPPSVSLRGRTLQVVVRYAGIVLTPEQPRYEGGVWDVEGLKNECIVASCTACLRNENITTPRLAFRSMVDEPDIGQCDRHGPKWTYGLKEMDPLNDDIGAVDCVEGRVVAHPNILQRCVQPFELEDGSKAGERTLAALFLVDPNKRITSTSDVPPQQQSWHDHASGLPEPVSADVKEVAGAKREFPVSLAHAKKLREELITERAYVTEMGNVPAIVDFDDTKYAAWMECDYDEDYVGNLWFHRRWCSFEH